MALKIPVSLGLGLVGNPNPNPNPDLDLNPCPNPNQGQKNTRCKVGDLTLSQLMAMPLKSGSRPPLLTEVLRSASHIGDGVQL